MTIGAGELVVIDWGAELDGYCSDCTRTLATGELSDRPGRCTSWSDRRSSRAWSGAPGRGVGGARLTPRRAT